MVNDVAATICGITINILKIPMYTPILLGSSVELNIAYGIDKMDPQEKPMQTNETISMLGSVMKYMLIKPYAPANSENMLEATAQRSFKMVIWIGYTGLLMTFAGFLMFI